MDAAAELLPELPNAFSTDMHPPDSANRERMAVFESPLRDALCMAGLPVPLGLDHNEALRRCWTE